MNVFVRCFYSKIEILYQTIWTRAENWSMFLTAKSTAAITASSQCDDTSPMVFKCLASFLKFQKMGSLEEI